MQIQTVFRAGNSDVVSLPIDVKKEAGIRPGTKVIVESLGRGEVRIRKAFRQKKKRVSLNAEFKRWWGTFLKDNSEILDELATR